jgi:phosphate transport system substrate-binding protein
VVAAVAAATPARAADDVVLLSETGTVALASAAPLPGAPTWRAAPAGQVMAAVCAEQPAPKVRLAIMAREPNRLEQERCRRNLGSDAVVVPIGREAVALVALAGAPAMSLTPEQVFRAIGANAGTNPPPARWSDVDPTLPQVAIMVQVPALDTPAGRIFGATVLEPGCGIAQAARAPFGVEERLAFCAALRAPVAVQRREGRPEDVATWLQSAGPGALAVVSHGELRRIAARVSVMPLAGMLPTVGNVANGTYVASREIELVIATPRAAPAAARRAAAALIFALVAESGIGPAGAIVAAGMVPLAPADRVQARERLMDLFEPGS